MAIDWANLAGVSGSFSGISVMATLVPPATSLRDCREVLAFYERAQPLVEQLLTMARDWRDAAPAASQAVEAHGEFVGLALHCDLRLNSSRRGQL